MVQILFNITLMTVVLCVVILVCSIQARKQANTGRQSTTTRSRWCSTDIVVNCQYCLSIAGCKWQCWRSAVSLTYIALTAAIACCVTFICIASLHRVCTKAVESQQVRERLPFNQGCKDRIFHIIDNRFVIIGS